MKTETARREIESLDYYLQNHTDDYSEESHTAMMMAVKVLDQEPCEDVISRQAVLDTTICEGISCNECSFNEIDGEPGCLLHARIDQLPPVNPTKTGHWIDTGSESFEFHRVYKCSECGNTEIEYPERICRHFRYCPNCGARMAESEDKDADSN